MSQMLDTFTLDPNSLYLDLLDSSILQQQQQHVTSELCGASDQPECD